MTFQEFIPALFMMTFVAVLGFGAWQLIAVMRRRRSRRMTERGGGPGTP